MTSTFETNNLECLNIGCKYVADKKDPCLNIMVEMTTIQGPIKDSYPKLNINLYDGDDDLFFTEQSYINSHMSGFDTVVIECSDKNVDLRNAVRGRLYVTR